MRRIVTLRVACCLMLLLLSAAVASAQAGAGIEQLAQSAKTQAALAEQSNATTQAETGTTGMPKFLEPMMRRAQAYKQGPGQATATEHVTLESAANALTVGTATMARTDAVTPTAPKRAARRADGTKTAVPGLYASKDLSMRGDSYDYYAAMQFIDTDSGTYMIGVWGLPDTVKVDIDYTTGTVSIAPQVVYHHASLGDIYIYALVGTAYNPKANITGTIDAKGVITLGGWGVFCDANGANKGKYFNAFSSSTWSPANSVMSYQNYKDATQVTTYQAHVEQLSANEVIIYNFAGNKASVYGTLTPSKTIKISPQHIMTNLFYGQFFCFPATVTQNGTNYTVKCNTKGNIVATQHADTLNLGTWAVAERLYGSTVALVEANSKLVTTAKIAWPVAKDADFSGSGTQADPYLIKTTDDLAALAQAVEAGNNYKGKVLKLAGDIDFVGVTEQYQPIGNADVPFDGTLLGDGKTIAHLNVNSRGFAYSGLFGYTGPEAVIKDITLTNPSIAGAGNTMGIVAGYNGGTISGITITSGKLNSQNNDVGGIAGQSIGVVQDCSFTGSVSAYGNTGSLVGYNWGAVKNSHALASVTVPGLVSTMDKSLGGLVGSSSPYAGTKPVIEDCYFAGSITESTGYGVTGGVVGMLFETEMRRCFNVAGISASRESSNDNATGGLAGTVYHSVVTDCYNAGTLVKTGTASDYVGGLFGYLSLVYVNGEPSDTSAISCCYNSGLVTSTPTYNNTLPEERGVYGAGFSNGDYKPAEHFLTNVWTDVQITGLSNTRFGKLTNELTGKLPEGFSADVWQVAPGQYPVLKGSASTHSAELSAAAVHFAGTENVRKMKSNAGLAGSSNITWKLYDSANKSFTDTTSSLSIKEDSLIVGKQYGTQVLIAWVGKQEAMKYVAIAAVPGMFKGLGTEDDPYLIENKQDFILLDSAVRVNGQPHIGDYFLMTNDIDFNYADDFRGVGAGTTFAQGNNLLMFGGTFDGGGHTIHRLAVKSYTLNDAGKLTKGNYYNYAGLFRIGHAKSVIKNVNIAADCRFDCYAYGGGVVGYTEGKVINCRNYATVRTVTSTAGGIVGQLADTAVVTGCYNAGTIISEAWEPGGIAGRNNGTITLCQNDGNVIAQHVLEGTSKAGTQQRAGGIVGVNYGEIDRCVNNGTVSAYSNVGGIAGSTSAIATITGTVNNGIAYCLGTADTRGGITGATNTGMKIENTYYDRSINVNGASAGAAFPGATGVATADLTSGNALQGLDAADFDYAAGKYPVLKAFVTEPATVALRSAWVKFSGNEIRTDVRHAEPVSAAEGLTWSLKSATSPYEVADGQLTVDLTQLSDTALAVDTLVAVNGAYSKVIALSTIPAILPGEGTAASPFQIRTRADLEKLAVFMQNNGVEYQGYYFKVLNDIDYADSTFTPIATGSVSFKADFDGNGKTISNYKFETTSSLNGKYIGFFGNVGAEAVVHDLTLDGTLAGYNYIGGFAGKLYGTLRNCVNKSALAGSASSSYIGGLAADASAGSLITQCHNLGTLTPKSSYVGGIVAWLRGGAKVTDCYNAAAISGKFSTVGGIAAMCQGTILNCYNTGEIQASSSVGGIVASARDNDTIMHCYNTGAITTTSGTVGGIVASSTKKANGLIADCYNTGAISAHGNCGGIAGNLSTGQVVTDCYNTAPITSVASSYVGGVFGQIQGTGTLRNYVSRVYNTGKVTSEYQHVGGVAGQASSITMDHIWNTGDVICTKASDSKVSGFVGGLVGGIYSYSYEGDTSNIVDSWNAGNVSAYGDAVGGISGYGDGPIIRCVNLGNVSSQGIKSTATRGKAGGLWGFGSASMFDCYNMGNVTGPDKVGGIEPALYGENVIKRVYSAGTVTATDSTSTWHVGGMAPLYSGNVVDSAFFDATVNPDVVTDNELATGLTTRDLFTEGRLGSAYVLTRACYPTLVGFEDNVRTNFAAADTLLDLADTPADVKHAFFVGVKPSVVWTSSDNLSVADDGTVTPLAKGEGWVKKTATVDGITLERTYVVNVTNLTGVTDVEAAAQVVSTEVYDLNGARVSHPSQGTYIVVNRYADGKTRATKQVVK